MSDRPVLSVVIATYNRPILLRRLLKQLAVQSLSAGAFEAVVVDDGSRQDVRLMLADIDLPYAVRVERQANEGAASARHRGVLAAAADVIVIVDDDMQVPPDFLARHMAHYVGLPRLAILGRIAPDPGGADMPLFERWHQQQLDEMAEDFQLGRRAPSGLNLYTGNVSFRRCDYLSAGGFDSTLGNSEDAELGLRLERLGVRFVFEPAARVLHGSDHTRLDRWRHRAEQYGVFDRRIGRKHPERLDADPWHYLLQLNLISRPLMLLAVSFPGPSNLLGDLSYGVASILDRVGFSRAAQAGVTLAFGINYFRGVRREVGSAHRAAVDFGGYLLRRRAQEQPAGRTARWLRTVNEVRADQSTMRAYEDRYGHVNPSQGSLTGDLVERIGLQILSAFRLAQTFDDLGHPLVAKAVSRLARHLFASDLHWQASIAPGVLIVHGMGIAISHKARVGPGCILFQNVTLGLGNDPVTQRAGAPVLEEGVHVGPGCTLIGPITIGAHSKLAPGVLLTHSIPPNTVVEPAALCERPRKVGRRPALKVEAVRS